MWMLRYKTQAQEAEVQPHLKIYYMTNGNKVIVYRLSL